MVWMLVSSIAHLLIWRRILACSTCSAMYIWGHDKVSTENSLLLIRRCSLMYQEPSWAQIIYWVNQIILFFNRISENGAHSNLLEPERTSTHFLCCPTNSTKPKYAVFNVLSDKAASPHQRIFGIFFARKITEMINWLSKQLKIYFLLINQLVV